MNRIVVSIRRSIFLALVCLSFIWLFPEPAEASCYFSWTCPKCAQAGRGTQTRGTAGPYASSSSCQAARSSASAPGMRIGGCSCSSSYKRSTRKQARKSRRSRRRTYSSPSSGFVGGMFGAMAPVLGAAIGRWLFGGGSGGGGRPQMSARDREYLKRYKELLALLKPAGLSGVNVSSFGANVRFEEIPVARTSPPVEFECGLNNIEDCRTELNKQCQATGMNSIYHTRGYAGCCPKGKNYLAAPIGLPIKDEICGMPQSTARGVKCVCVITKDECIDAGAKLGFCYGG